MAAGANTRAVVDKPEVSRGETFKGRYHIAHGKGQVVNPRTPPFQKLPDRRIRAGRLQQLDVAVARAQHQLVHPIDIRDVIRNNGEPVVLLIIPGSGANVVDRKTNMMDARVHWPLHLLQYSYGMTVHPGGNVLYSLTVEDLVRLSRHVADVWGGKNARFVQQRMVGR